MPPSSPPKEAPSAVLTISSGSSRAAAFNLRLTSSLFVDAKKGIDFCLGVITKFGSRIGIYRHAYVYKSIPQGNMVVGLGD